MKQPTRNIGLRIPGEVLEKLRYIAREECRSTSSMIRVLVYECVERYEGEHGEILFSGCVKMEKRGE